MCVHNIPFKSVTPSTTFRNMINKYWIVIDTKLQFIWIRNVIFHETKPSLISLSESRNCILEELLSSNICYIIYFYLCNLNLLMTLMLDWEN